MVSFKVARQNGIGVGSILELIPGFEFRSCSPWTVGDVIDENGEIVQTLTVSKSKMKGKKKSRGVLLNAAARHALRSWLPELAARGWMLKEHPLFPTKGGKPLDRVGAWRIIRRVKRRLGLRGCVATHSLRKTFGDEAHERLKELAARGEKVDVLLETQHLLGHESPQSTLRYLELDAGIGNAVVMGLNLGDMK